MYRTCPTWGSGFTKKFNCDLVFVGLPVLNRVWYSRVATATKIQSSLCSRYYAKAVTSGENHLRRLGLELHIRRRNVAAVASRWRHCADIYEYCTYRPMSGLYLQAMPQVPIRAWCDYCNNFVIVIVDGLVQKRWFYVSQVYYFTYFVVRHFVKRFVITSTRSSLLNS